MNRGSPEMFLDLLIDCLTRRLFVPRLGALVPVPETGSWRIDALRPFRGMLRRHGVELVWNRPAHFPPEAETMVSHSQLIHLRGCIERVIREDIPGDFIETGVWRGGTCILMRAALEAYGDEHRTVWVADSFKGLPKPNTEKYPADRPFDLSPAAPLAVSAEQVTLNFIKYGFWDYRVRLLEGWFKDTLPTAPIDRLAILRLDGDLYESTIDAMNALYPKLSVGGYLLIDDYAVAPPCRDAIHDYRVTHGITEEITRVDACGAYWRRES